MFSFWKKKYFKWVSLGMCMIAILVDGERPSELAPNPVSTEDAKRYLVKTAKPSRLKRHLVKTAKPSRLIVFIRWLTPNVMSLFLPSVVQLVVFFSSCCQYLGWLSRALSLVSLHWFNLDLHFLLCGKSPTELGSLFGRWIITLYFVQYLNEPMVNIGYWVPVISI